MIVLTPYGRDHWGSIACFQSPRKWWRSEASCVPCLYAGRICMPELREWRFPNGPPRHAFSTAITQRPISVKQLEMTRSRLPEVALFARYNTFFRLTPHLRGKVVLLKRAYSTLRSRPRSPLYRYLGTTVALPGRMTTDNLPGVNQGLTRPSSPHVAWGPHITRRFA